MDLLLFFLFLAASTAAASTGAMFPTGGWYARLKKPGWTPPNRLFPIAWTTIYLLIAFAGARVAPLEGSAVAMALWAVQIALNALWTPVFFGARRMKAALVVMGALWCAVLAALVAHWRLDPLAGLAFVPYLGWLCVAFALNASILRLNPEERPLRFSEL